MFLVRPVRTKSLSLVKQRPRENPRVNSNMDYTDINHVEVVPLMTFWQNQEEHASLKPFTQV